MTETTAPRGLIGALEQIADGAGEEGMSLGEFVDALGERAFGIILFAMALPVSIPFLYGVPQVMALPMMALSVQMVMGRGEPWLPARFKASRLEKRGLTRMAQGGRKWFGWLEALARPRLTALSGPTAERLVGGIFVIFCTTFLTYLFNGFALKHLKASTVSAFLYIQPLIGIIFALSIGKDNLDLLKIGATILIFIGVYLATKKPKPSL